MTNPYIEKWMTCDIGINLLRRWRLRTCMPEKEVSNHRTAGKRQKPCHNSRSCLKSCGRRVLIPFHSETESDLREYQIPCRSPSPPPLACPRRLEWLVVSLDGDYWSAWRAPAVSAQDWRPRQREFLANVGPCLRSAVEPRRRMDRPVLKCGLYELGARWSRNVSVYLNNQAQVSAEDNNKHIWLACWTGVVGMGNRVCRQQSPEVFMLSVRLTG